MRKQKRFWTFLWAVKLWMSHFRMLNNSIGRGKISKYFHYFRRSSMWRETKKFTDTEFRVVFRGSNHTCCHKRHAGDLFCFDCSNSYIVRCSFLVSSVFLKRLSGKIFQSRRARYCECLSSLASNTWVVLGIYGTNVAHSNTRNKVRCLQTASSIGWASSCGTPDKTTTVVPLYKQYN